MINTELKCECGGNLLKKMIKNNPDKFVYRCSNFFKKNCKNIYVKENGSLINLTEKRESIEEIKL